MKGATVTFDNISDIKIKHYTSSRLGRRALATADHALEEFSTCPSASFVFGHLFLETENAFNSSRHHRILTVAFKRCA